LAIIKRRDLYTFTHLLNVTILSMHFASRLGFIREDVMEIGLSALFHDIGKMYIADLVKKAGELTGEEFSKIKSHAILGAELLLKYSDNLGIAPVVVAFEHHLGYDLKGYPKTPFNRKPHQISYIVSICDVYDALLSRRSYKWDYPPDMVYDIMMKQRGKLFEPDLLDEFFRIMGVWPVGTIVVLSDGRVAVVRKENYDDVFLPVIEIISDKAETIDLKENKGAMKIEKFLNPLGEGKEYLDKI
jgi:putative nucleotidyltransferase with HDIG domain